MERLFPKQAGAAARDLRAVDAPTGSELLEIAVLLGLVSLYGIDGGAFRGD